MAIVDDGYGRRGGRRGADVFNADGIRNNGTGRGGIISKSNFEGVGGDKSQT